jgi:hypothetical protein
MMLFFRISVIAFTLSAPAWAQLLATPHIVNVPLQNSFDVTGAPPGFDVNQVQVTFRQLDSRFRVEVVEIVKLTATSFRVRVSARASRPSSSLAIVRVPGVTSPVTVLILVSPTVLEERFQLTSDGNTSATVKWVRGSNNPVSIRIKVDFIPLAPDTQRMVHAELSVVTGDIDWLILKPSSGETPLNIEAVIDPAKVMQLPTDSPTLAIIGVRDNGGSFLLELNVEREEIPLTLSRNNVPISYVLGAPPPPAETVRVNGTGMFTAFQMSGGDWLQVSPASAVAPADVQLRLRGPLTEFRTYESVIRMFPSTSTGTVDLTVTLIVQESGTSVITQIAAGAEWKTTLILVNTSQSASTFALRLRDDAGNDWPVSMLRLGPAAADLGIVSTLSETIPPGGTFTYQTREQPSSPVRSGYAELTSGTGIRGQAIFQQANPGGFDYEAAIPMSFGTRQFFAPFDNAAATTSIALVNQGTASSVTAYVRNERGELLDTRILTLAPGQHRAEELERLVGSSVVSGSRRGTVEFRSEGAPIAALGLRFRGPFTSFPVIAAGGTATSAGNPVMAQIAAGSEWKTTLLLVNTTAAAQTFTLLFWRSDGSSWPLPLQRVGPVTADLGTVAILSETIPAYGMYTYQTSAQGAVSSGFAELTSGAGVRGQAVFQQILPGGMSYEAAAPMETGARNFLIPYDNVNTAGRPATTSVALVNPGPTSATTQMTIRDDRGTVIGTGPLTLIAGEQTADTLEAVTFGLVRNKRGTVEFSFSGADVSALGLRFRGPFTSFSAIPK